jgi:hypothetical protein
MRFAAKLLITATIAGSITTTATASMISFTGIGTMGGLPVNVSADLVTGNGMVTVTLNNLQANPSSVIQGISDFGFFIKGITDPAASLVSSTGHELNITDSGTFTVAPGAVDTGWELTTPSSGPFAQSVYLNVVGTAIGPAHLILGPPNTSTNLYDATGGGSIQGNAPHNPFLASGASFTIDVAGVTADTRIQSVIFSFGTSAGNNLDGTCSSDCGGDQAPEPGTLALLGGGLIMIGAFRRRLG